MSSRSGNLAREVLTIVLFFLCIVSGGIYLSLHKEKPAAIQLAFGGSENSSTVANYNAVAQVPVNQDTSLVPPVQENKNSLPVQINSNSIVSVNQNISTTAVTNTNVNTTPAVPAAQNSLQSLAQTKLGANYLVVKTDYKENKLFETLTPYTSAVVVDRYILQKNGDLAGYLYEIKKVDPQIRNINLFLRDLVQRVLVSPKVTVSDAAFGRRGFYYNNIDKPELLRIVVESKTGANYAVDVPANLKEDFNEFFRSL